MGKNIIFSNCTSERTLMRVSDENQKVHHTAQKVNGETKVSTDDSEEGDNFDDESLYDSFYSGMFYFLTEYFI